MKPPGFWKVCRRCGEMLSLASFGKDARVADGRKSRCHPCEAITVREWRNTNRARANEVNRVWRTENKQRVLETNRRWRVTHREEQTKNNRARHLKHRFKLTITEFESMLANQNGGCAICGATAVPNGPRLHVDHDHRTGMVRGILCYGCNTGLGLLGDNPERIEAAAAYLRKGTADMKRQTERVGKQFEHYFHA